MQTQVGQAFQLIDDCQSVAQLQHDGEDRHDQKDADDDEGYKDSRGDTAHLRFM